jgi:uncharacterized protein YkwD
MATIRNVFIFVTSLAIAGASGVVAGLTAVQQKAPTTSAVTTATVSTVPTNPVQPPPSGSSGAVTTNPDDGCPVGGPVAGSFLPTLINNYRTSKGLSSLPYDFTKLGGIAQSRVTDMVNNNYVGVINSKGQDITTEMSADKVPFSNAALIVFKGCLGNPASNNVSLNAWLANPTTAAALNNPNWDDMDYGSTYQVTSPGLKGYYLETLVFRKK